MGTCQNIRLVVCICIWICTCYIYVHVVPYLLFQQPQAVSTDFGRLPISGVSGGFLARASRAGGGVRARAARVSRNMHVTRDVRGGLANGRTQTADRVPIARSNPGGISVAPFLVSLSPFLASGLLDR